MHDDISKPWNVYSITLANHISPEQSSVSIRIHKPLLGNGWWN